MKKETVHTNRQNQTLSINETSEKYIPFSGLGTGILEENDG